MTKSTKKKRINYQYYTFFFSCLVSLLGLIFYIICSKYIRFPSQWFPQPVDVNGVPKPNLFLLFSGIDVHLQVNIFLGLIFAVLSHEKMDQTKIQKWKFWISKSLIFILSLGFGLFHYWNGIVQGGIGNVLLLCLIITVINCCLIELLIQLMNQYGICNAFNFILFTEFVPFGWLWENWNKTLIIYLFLITIFLVWITNLKWEAPIETNTIYSRDSKVLKKHDSKLGFRLNFSFMPLIHLSSFISYIYTFFLMKGRTNWTNIQDISDRWQETSMEKISSATNRLKGGEGFWYCFFAFNEEKFIFKWSNVKSWFSKNKWIIVGVFSLLIFLRWLVVWVQMRKASSWKTGEMSKNLRSKGVYISRIPPGSLTRKLLKKIINKLILFWNFIILVFHIIFDNIFFSRGRTTKLNFMGWFGSVNIGVDLLKQIRTKYKYIKTSK